MSPFNTYLRLGYEHIVNLSALDHVLFIVVLIAIYQPKHWLKMLIAVSLFTLGHSISLTLSSFDIIKVDKGLIELLIPATIVVTALINLTKFGQNPASKSKYWIAILFGIIHGFGFSNYYEMLVLGENKYWSALLPFNLGIELGQLLVFVAFLLLMFLGQSIMSFKSRDWNIFFSGAGFGLAIIMCLENWPW